MKVMKLLIAVALVACGGSSKGGTSTNPSSDDPNDCGIVADKVVALMAEKAGITDADAKQKVHASLSGACVTGSWSAEVRACFVNAADETAMGACGDMLDDAQKQDLADSIAAGTATE